MAITKAERARREKEKCEAAWRAEEERVRRLGDLFDSLPACWQKDALKEKMSDQIIEYYNHCKWSEGDAILQFLPNDYAHALLDWYFDDDNPNSTFPPTPAASQDEVAQPGQVQGEPQSPSGTDGLNPEQAPASLRLVHS